MYYYFIRKQERKQSYKCSCIRTDSIEGPKVKTKKTGINFMFLKYLWKIVCTMIIHDFSVG